MGFQGEVVDALSLRSHCPVLNEKIGVHLMVYDYDNLRGALRPNSLGQTPRGDLTAVQRLITAVNEEGTT
jgi:hypothetical protein